MKEYSIFKGYLKAAAAAATVGAVATAPDSYELGDQIMLAGSVAMLTYEGGKLAFLSAACGINMRMNNAEASQLLSDPTSGRGPKIAAIAFAATTMGQVAGLGAGCLAGDAFVGQLVSTDATKEEVVSALPETDTVKVGVAKYQLAFQ